MTHIAIIGAGITGVTTAYALLERGYEVTVLDKHRYAAMETSFANGGQLSASNAEVWNSTATILKGLRWMFRRDAPLLMNPRPNWHKYSWMGEFVANIGNYRANTIETTRLAIEARKHLFEIAAREGIDFDLERRGILHIYHDKKGFESGLRVNALLQEGGLDRRPVTPEEIRTIEPTLRKDYYGGFYTPSDATGDIHKFTRGLADVCKRRGATFIHEANIDSIAHAGGGFVIGWARSFRKRRCASARGMLKVDGVVVCAGVASRHFAAMLDERVNVYPVKGYSITVQLDTRRKPRCDADRQPARRGRQDRHQPAWRRSLSCCRHGRVQRLQPRHPRRSRAATGRLGAQQLSGGRDVAGYSVGGAAADDAEYDAVGAAGRRPGVFFNTGHGHLGWTLSAATAQMIAGTIDGWRGLNAPPTVPSFRGELAVEREMRRAS